MMKKRTLACLLAMCMLLPCAPALSISARAAESIWSTSFWADRQVSTTEDPLTYKEWAKANSGIEEGGADYETQLTAYMGTLEAKAAYKAYYLTKGKVIWEGDWMTGGINKDTGAFSPIAYHTQFVSANWNTFGGPTWYSTQPAAEFFLDWLLRGEGNTSLWGFANIPFHVNVAGTNQACFSAAYTSYFSFTYTVPEERAGALALSVLTEKTTLTATTRMCVMVNDSIIWPSGATVANSATWCHVFNVNQINAELAMLGITAEAGDKIHFVVADRDGSFVYLNPCVSEAQDTTWTAVSAAYAGGITPAMSYTNIADILDTYATFCTAALDPTAATSQQAYKDYVLNDFKMSWTGTWSAGEMLLSGNQYSFEPFLYRLYHAKSDLDNVDATSRRYVTASTMEKFLNAYLKGNGSNNLWGGVGNVIYGYECWPDNQYDGNKGLTGTNNATWASATVPACIMARVWTAPEGVTSIRPCISEFYIIANKQTRNTRLCIMKNDVPVWPSGATNVPTTWATQTSQGWAGVNPTAEELNTGWANVSITVAKGDKIAFCLCDDGADIIYDYRFGITNLATGANDIYLANSTVLKEKTVQNAATGKAERAIPVAYNAFCAAGAEARGVGSTYDKGGYAKTAYIATYLKAAALTQTGDWRLGQLKADGSFAPLSAAIAVTGKKASEGYTTAPYPYATTEDGMRALLTAYLAGNTVSLSALTQDALYTAGTDGYYAAAGGGYISAWRYTTPKNGRVHLSLVSAAGQNALFCIKKNGTILYPSGATADTTTWQTLSAGTAAINTALSSLAPYLAAGDKIDFCLARSTGAEGTAVLLPKVEIYSPLAELFELSAGVSLGEQFGVTFYATYQTADMANAAAVSFTGANGAPLTPTTADTANADGSLTRRYTLNGIAAKDLTDEIGYAISCTLGDENKATSGTVSVAELTKVCLKRQGAAVDVSDPTSALALATLNYAAAAQKYFGLAGTAANADIPSAQQKPSLKVTGRELPDATGNRTAGATFTYEGATLILGDTMQVRLYLTAAEGADAEGATVHVKLDGKDFAVGSLSAYGETGTSYIAAINIPMRYFGTNMEFAVYDGDNLISDTLSYGVGCYAKRMYAGGNEDMKDLLDNVLALGDAAEEYYAKVSNAVSTTVAVPAAPGETIDLACYPLNTGNEVIPGEDVTWAVADVALANGMVYGRYVLAPSTPGEYKMIATYGTASYIVKLVVTANGATPSCAVAEKLAASVIDLSSYGQAAAAANADVPSYWKWTLNMAAYLADANAAGVSDQKKLDSFIFLTDTHWEMNNKNSFQLANYLAAELDIDRLHFGGDMLNGSADLTEAEKTYASWLAAANTLASAWYPVRGNHDQNASWRPNSFDDVITDAELYDKIFAASDAANDDGRLYYYVDDAAAKIRYYFLADYSTGPTVDNQDTDDKEGVNTVAYADQLAWLQETAADLQDGWGIVVTEHRMFASGTPAAPILSNFAEDLLPVLDEIDGKNGIEVIAVFSGHTHWDASYQSENGGYYIIATTNDGGQPDPYLPGLEAGTNYEQRFDIVQIDRENHRLYLTRIGSGECRVFTW